MEEKFEVNDKIIHDFITSRENLNKIVLSHADNVIKRFYSLDSQVYRDSILSSKIKEMLGLVSSLVLRCDDCVKYHLNQCFERKVSTGEIVEVLSVGLVVGGSIVIPHLRRAMEFWVALEKRRFNSIYQKIEEEIEKKREDLKVNKIEVRENLLRYICELCSNNIPYYNWFGFYLVNNKEDNFLYLGPYVGEATTHIKIPFGKGICGQAAQKKNTIVVDDVSGENNYLACSIKVKSELVTPILRGDLVLGEIDIDSHQLNAFSELDKEFIEKLANLIEPIL